jgi:hypothetical protein
VEAEVEAEVGVTARCAGGGDGGGGTFAYGRGDGETAAAAATADDWGLWSLSLLTAAKPAAANTDAASASTTLPPFDSHDVAPAALPVQVPRWRRLSQFWRCSGRGGGLRQ